MPSKKKSKTSFHVPEELQVAPQAGWVYRSDGPTHTKGTKAPHKSGSDGKGAGKIRKAAAVHPAPTPLPEPAAKPETSSAHTTDSPSKSSKSFMTLGADAMSAGLGTAGNLLLLTARVMTAPLALGKRLLGF